MNNRKNNLIRVVATVLTAVFMLCLMVPEKGAASDLNPSGSTVPITGTYFQTDARSMLTKVNKYRVNRGLSTLKYDYKLEKLAMQRAAELSVLRSMTRPNGKSSLKYYASKGYKWRGENIAWGFNDTATLFEFFKDEEYCSKNLKNSHFTCIGASCFLIDGRKYWVLAFGSPRKGKKKTSPVNGTRTVNIQVADG